MTAAAVSRSTPSGTGTTADAGSTAWRAALPSVCGQATRSPSRTPSTPGPTERTVPAASLPPTNGGDVGYTPSRW